MFKKKKKAIDRSKSSVLTSDIAFENTAKALKEAYKIAKFNRDLDAIVAISDRWSMLARVLDNEEEVKLPMGFVREQEDRDEHNG